MIGIEIGGGWKFQVFTDYVVGDTCAVLTRKMENGSREYLGPKGGAIVAAREETPRDLLWHLEGQHLQAMMDGLWEVGVRPKDRRYENEMELQRAHLEDMRRLVFKEAGRE